MTRATASAQVGFAFTVAMLGTTLPTPLYPLYQERFGYSGLTSTVIYATYAAGVCVALLLFGSLSDQIGRRWMLLPGLLLSAESAIVFFVAGNVEWLLVGRLLSGLSAGIFAGTATAALVDLAPPGKVGRASLIAAAVNTGGLGLGPLLSGTIAEYTSQPLRMAFLVDLVLLEIATVCVAFMPEPVARIRRARLRRLRVPAEVRSTFIHASAAGFAGFAVLGMFTAIAASLLRQVMDHPNHFLTGLLAFTGFAASIVGQVLSARMANRRAMVAGCVILIGAAALVAGSLAMASAVLLVTSAVAAGLGQGISFRAGLAMINAKSPANQRAEVASSFFMVLYIALSIPIIGVGAAAQHFGLVRAGIVFSVLVALLPLAALISLLRRGDEPVPVPPQRRMLTARSRIGSHPEAAALEWTPPGRTVPRRPGPG